MSDIVDELKQKGNAAFANKEYKKASKIYRDAIKLDPNNYVLYSNRAMAFLKLEDYERALRDCDKGLDLSPDLKAKVKLVYRKAAAWSGLNEFETAKKLLLECLDLEPTNQAAKTELKRIEGLTGTQSEDKEQITRLNGFKRKRENSGEITSIIDIPIEIVDELPPEFQPIESQNLQDHSEISKQEKQKQSKVLSLEEELSQIEGVTVPSSIKTKTKINKQEEESKFKSNSISNKVAKNVHNFSQFPESPTLLYLSNLNKSNEEEKKSHYLDILKLTPDYLKKLFGSVGMDADFLEYYMDAVTWYCHEDERFLNSNILESLDAISKISRFSLVLVFLSSDKLNNMKKMINEKMNVDLGKLWS